MQQYLSQFQSVSSQKFAVIKVGGAILTDYIDVLCSSLRNLNQMGLFPVIIHGAGPQMNKLLEEAGIEPSYSEGIRITDGPTLGIARKLFLEENLKLVEALESWGVRARPITSGVLMADYKDKETWKFVGEVNKVNTDPINAAIADNYIPVLTCMAENTEGQLLNVNADKAAAELAKALVPLKIVYLSEKGGLHNKDTGKLIEAINLDEEYDRYMNMPWVIHGTRSKIRDIKDLLDHLPRSSSVAIIHPESLERELFTHTGAGTLIRRGTKLQKASSLSEISDMKKLKEVLVRDREGLDAEAVVDRYLDSLKGKPFTAYHDEGMEALAVVLPPDSSSSSTVGQSHDPAVHLTVVGHATNIIRRQVLIGNVALGVAGKLLASQLARRNMAEIHVGVAVQEVNQSLAGVTASTDESDLGRPVLVLVLDTKRGVRVGGGCVGASGRNTESAAEC